MNRRVLLSAALSVAATIAFTAPAGAAIIPVKQAQFSSAQLVDGRIVWFQRNDRYKWFKHRPPNVTPGVGALYARVLTEKTAQRVYLPPKGQKIVGYKVGGGRIVIGLAAIAAEGHGPSQIVELTPGSAAPWPAKTIASDTDVTDASTCHSRVELVGVQPNGDAIVQHDRLEARGADCLFARQVGQLTAYAKDGSSRQLQTRKSGWSNGEAWTLLPALQPSASDWMLQLVANDFSDSSVVSSFNVSTGERKSFTNDPGDIGRVEPLTGGGLVLRVWWYEGLLMPSAANPADTRSLQRSGHETWFHACGSQIIEFARQWRRPHHGKWKIYLRNSDGKTTSRLKTRLPVGTMFDACDQNTAVFHRTRHDGSASQWALRLAP